MFSGLVAQWITRLPTEQKIPGSTPGELDIFFFIETGFLIIQPSFDTNII